MWILWASLLVIAVFWLITKYNGLLWRDQNVRKARADLGAALDQRDQVAHQILDLASTYADEERQTQLRLAEKTAHALTHVWAIAQAFPVLQANATYQQLMAQLQSLEQTILARREAYNSAANVYNTFRNSFSTLLAAPLLRFKPAVYSERGSLGESP